MMPVTTTTRIAMKITPTGISYTEADVNDRLSGQYNNGRTTELAIFYLQRGYTAWDPSTDGEIRGPARVEYRRLAGAIEVTVSDLDSRGPVG